MSLHYRKYEAKDANVHDVSAQDVRFVIESRSSTRIIVNDGRETLILTRKH